MALGLSTYAFFWQWSERATEPLSLERMLQKTRDLDVDVFQVCDYPLIEQRSDDELRELSRVAGGLGIRLELGTRGVRPAHLRRYLHIAERLGVTLVRTMIATADDHLDESEAEGLLCEVLPEYERAGVTIALETYEQVPTSTLVGIVERIGSPRLGICSDPANCVAALESPAELIARVAPHVVNMHIKDFAFTRHAGWVGFSLTGAPLGEGLLDYAGMIAAIEPEERAINQIIEHWLPWQGDAETTFRLEDEWTAHNVRYVRSMNT
ncbi:sugar phosphate isomerase/epimerase family protein [Paramicrobacterium agarici]|uniref:sugar phosphate isomerase/epimerase family protein n=1 Tax=Paramicrobacterium agarici TaxID=630514 RepID=UPI0011512E84|nr:TIM barrel protein [Microbacterium agarici]TQO21870.1 sugar phosphate isomerase/epimerase [Microbacterium agarici]